MSRTNIQVVQEYIEIMNQRQLDRIFDYCSKDCILHGAPYAGLGFALDFNAEKILIQTITPGSPCAGQLQTGDELIRATDGEHTWENFQELKNGGWGLGMAGTQVIVTIRRDGKLLEVPITRGLINAFTLKLSERIESIRVWQEDWPDLKEEVNLILGSGDWVTTFSTIGGLNRKFHHSAIWAGCSIYHLRDGKIIEIMGVEDEYSQMKQLGYQIIEPQRETTGS